MSCNDVLVENASMVDITGRDETYLYAEDARVTLAVVIENNYGYTYLMESNPPCSSVFICDGAFVGNAYHFVAGKPLDGQ